MLVAAELLVPVHARIRNVSSFIVSALRLKSIVTMNAIAMAVKIYPDTMLLGTRPSWKYWQRIAMRLIRIQSHASARIHFV